MSIRALVAALAGVLFLCGSVVAQTPSLAEVAKKEQERRKTVKAPAKVLTPQEVSKAAPAPAAPATGGDEAAATLPGAEKGVQKDAGKPGEPAKDESWWRARVTQVHEELRRNEVFAEALQTRVNSLTNDFGSRDDPYQRARVADDRLKALTELERVKADIELQKKQLADIEEEARRAGVPPGWIR